MKSAEEIIWWVLEAIKRELELQAYGLLTVINFDLEDLTSKDSNSPPIRDARKVVYLLERKYKALEVADIDNPKERKAHQNNALDYYPTRGTATRFVFEMPDRIKFDDVYREYKEKSPRTKKELKCGKLVLNFTKGTIKYGVSKSIEISPKQDEIRFLALLMSNDRIVDYKEIADELDMVARITDHMEMTKSVQYLRRNLVPILEDAGMTREEIRDMIISKRGVGYKLRR